MRKLKVGLKLKSSTCTTQIIVLKAAAGEHEIACGGAEMIDTGDTATKELNPAFADGTLIGKRYVTEDESLEILCTKDGAGSLALDGVKLVVKQPKKLPSSD
jgi:hypothetical protein